MLSLPERADESFAADLRISTCPPGSCATVYARHFNGETWWNYVKVLADDKMEGRETGSRGEQAAQDYAIDQLKRNGVSPAGMVGFLQPMNFVSRQIVEKDCSLTVVIGDKREPLTLGEDAIIMTRALPAPEVNAGLVFVGYGLKVPEKDYDDFRDLDVKGKLVVTVSGLPPGIPGPLASHYRSLRERWKTLKSLGAIGIVSIPNPASMDIPWSRITLNRTHPSMDLDYPEFNETQGAALFLFVNPARAEKLFVKSGHTFEEIIRLGKNHKRLPRFSLRASLEAKTRVETAKIQSANVVGKLPGSDPALKDEYVVVSAHLDHLGMGEPVNGDRIYNGAMDNASGSALLLDLAASLKDNSEKLRRSVLFVLFTAEEKGLLGSKFFTAHPTVAARSMVTDINVDMFLPIVPLKVLTVYGLSESDLGDSAQQVAAAVSVPVQPDPEPQRDVFIRSDQYNFILHGIPSLMMDVGYKPGSPQRAVFKEWLTHRYHAPSDDLNQPVDLAAAAKYEEIVRGLLIKIANADSRPQWKPKSFFRRYAQ
ncbi:MAG: M28 family peptidase [Acidobacteria bacterium]|nr:M28 family peptidase [Acidobacteriota bacterium]